MSRVSIAGLAVVCCAGTLVSGQLKTPQQCATEIQRRHAAVAASLAGHQTSEIAQAIADSDAKNPSLARCIGRRPQGGGSDTSSVMSNNPSGDPQLDGDENGANKSADKPAAIDTTKVTFTDIPVDPPKEPPKAPPTGGFHKKAVILGGGAAIGTTLILVDHGGGGSPSPAGGSPGGGGTTGGGGTSPVVVTDFSGTYKGVAHNLPAGTTCPSPTPSYDETATLVKQSANTYQATLADNPSFGRSFVLVLDATNAYNATGTAPFNAAETYTGTLNIVNGAPTMMLTEQTQFPTCATVNVSTLVKQ